MNKKLKGIAKIFSNYKGRDFRWLAVIDRKIYADEDDIKLYPRWVLDRYIIGEIKGNNNLEGELLIYKV